MVWGHNNPNPFFIRRGFYPNPRPFPSPGEGMQPPYSGSVIKVLLPKVGRREISYATELRLFVFAPLTYMGKL